MNNILLRSPLGNFDLRNFFRSAFENDDVDQWLQQGALAVDISEGKEGETIVRASLPGFKKEDVHVSVHNGVLDIKAESTEETETKNEKFFRRERRFGSVARRIALPGNPGSEDVAADLKDGVLTVKVRPAAKDGPKKIAIN